MTAPRYAFLPGRAVLAVSGEGRKSFLQGVLSCDMRRVSPCGGGGAGAWGALCAPQGKVLFDLFLSERDGVVYLETDAGRIEDLNARLSRYRLRAKVVLEIMKEWSVAVAFDGAARAFGLEACQAFGSGVALRDPRLAQGGARVCAPRSDMDAAFHAKGLEAGNWDAWRIPLALPEGDRDIDVGKGFLLEYGFDELHGVDFRKGCYVGQETTARMKWKGLTKRRLVPFVAPFDRPDRAGLDICGEDGVPVGAVRSAAPGMFLGFVRLAALAKPLFVAGHPVSAAPPRWMKDALPDLG